MRLGQTAWTYPVRLLLRATYSAIVMIHSNRPEASRESNNYKPSVVPAIRGFSDRDPRSMTTLSASCDPQWLDMLIWTGCEVFNLNLCICMYIYYIIWNVNCTWTAAFILDPRMDAWESVEDFEKENVSTSLSLSLYIYIYIYIHIHIDIHIFLSKVNIWNVNYARATAWTDVPGKVSKFLR